MIVSLLWLQALTDYSAIGSAIEHIPNLHQIEPGLYRGGRPQPDGLNTLASMNVKTIINLERGWFEREPDDSEAGAPIRSREQHYDSSTSRCTLSLDPNS